MMTKAEIRAVDRERAKLRKLLPDAPVITYAQWKREKEALRMRDYERIARGEATPAQIQRENSIFTNAEVRRMKLLNRKQVLAHWK